MTAAYFEDHPTDPDKVILRKPKHDDDDDSLGDEDAEENFFDPTHVIWRREPASPLVLMDIN